MDVHDRANVTGLQAFGDQILGKYHAIVSLDHWAIG
jgi:hypothetical protein